MGLKMIRNEADLRNLLNQHLETALNNTIQIALEKLLDYIESDVYSYSAVWTNGSNGESGRTGDFLDSWGSTKATLLSNMSEVVYSAQILQDKPLEHISPFIHGSEYYNGVLNENNLNSIINEGLSRSNFNFPAIQARPFWTHFTEWCDKNLDNIFIKQCQLLGIPIQRFSYTVG